MASLNVGVDDGQPPTSNNFRQVGQITDAQNPLRNPVILNHLFQLCPPDILACSRQVGRQWRDISSSSWRRSSPLIFYWDITTHRISLGKGSTPLNVFWEYYYNPENKCREIPFRSVKFKKFQFDSSNKEIKIFWRVFGNDLTTLTLKHCTFPEVDEFRRIIFNYFPHLKKLSLSYCTYQTSEPSTELEVTPESSYVEPAVGRHLNLRFLHVYEQNPFPISMLELLSHFQSLKEITYLAYTPQFNYRRGNVANLLNAIKIIREHDETKLNLTRFNISGIGSTIERFRLIQELNLPLEMLHINLDQVGAFASQVLGHHSRTLRSDQFWTLRVQN